MLADLVKPIAIIHTLYSTRKALRIAERLNCQNCGECCRIKVQVTAKERRLIAKSEKVKVPSIIEPPCMFLKDNKCTIYPIRPLVCRLFPTYPHERGIAIFVDCPKGDELYHKIRKELNGFSFS